MLFLWIIIITFSSRTILTAISHPESHLFGLSEVLWRAIYCACILNIFGLICCSGTCNVGCIR
jgi:hypothetical protein